MKLTNSQNKQIEILSDGEWHSLNNNGIKGLKCQSLDALIEKGLVVEKRNNGKTLDPEQGVVFSPWYDIFYKLNEVA